MRKVIVPYQAEQSIKYCDKHKKRECAGNLWLTFGYGSQYDLSEVSIDMCDECADKLSRYLKKEFGEDSNLKESK